jgi:SAM-dependent methyltransferase
MGRAMRLAVTTVLGASRAEEQAAREAARRHGLPVAERGERPLAAVARAAGVDVLLVLGRHASLWLEGAEHRWHPGMGALRARRLARGERSTGDPFLEAVGVRPGDAVLDCTLGLGADALVAAEAVGAGGRVLGLESSPALAAWVGEGMRLLATPAARRVEVLGGDHARFLEVCPGRSFDVVVFDPMFRHARAQAPGFEVVRRLADPRPLAPEVLERARRVARRCVVVKDGTPGWDLARLGLRPLPSRRGALRLYARMDAA